jgi:hypothetical protein
LRRIQRLAATWLPGREKELFPAGFRRVKALEKKLFRQFWTNPNCCYTPFSVASMCFYLYAVSEPVNVDEILSLFL